MSESLVQHLIREDFGDQCAMVANLILQNGELSLVEIIGQTKLPFEEIKNVLVVLIKHNIIIFLNKANPPNVDQAKGPADLIEDFVYKVSVKDVLSRLRFLPINFICILRIIDSQRFFIILAESTTSLVKQFSNNLLKMVA